MKNKLLLLTISVMFTFNAMNVNAQVQFQWNGTSKLNLKKKNKNNDGNVNNEPSSNNSSTQKKTAKVYSEAEKTKILDKSNYPDYSKDKEKIETISKSYYNANIYNVTPKMVEELPDATLTLDNAKNKYEEYWNVYELEMGKPEYLADKHYNTYKTINNLKYDLKNKYSGDLAADTKKNLNKALILSEEKSTVLDSEDAKKISIRNRNNYPKYLWKEVDASLDEASIEIFLLKSRGEKQEVISELQKKKEETIAKIAPYKNEYDTKLLKLDEAEFNSVIVPTEKYNGADKEALRKKIIALNNSCEKTKLIKVIFTEKDWVREQGSDYSSSTKSFIYFDYSYLYITLIYNNPSENQEIGFMSSLNNFRLVKNNISNKLEDPKYNSCPEVAQENFRKMFIKNIPK